MWRAPVGLGANLTLGLSIDYQNIVDVKRILFGENKKS